MPSPSLQFGALGEDAIDGALAVALEAFHEDVPTEEDKLARLRRTVASGRGTGAFDGDALVGVTVALDLHLTVPGGNVVPCTGLTFVSVLPTHRRRGALRGMVARVLADARAAGQPLASLWSSEQAIYGRFGSASPPGRRPSRSSAASGRSRSA